MAKSIVIVGAGFAGIWSALSAMRLIRLEAKEDEIEVTVIAPQPSLVIRPRLYEANAASMVHPVEDLLAGAGSKLIQGVVERIRLAQYGLTVRTHGGDALEVSYDRLILAAGSSLARPSQITGIQEHTFDVDSIESATRLEDHLRGLHELPPTTSRNTIVVCGGGFTGIELATELPRRLDPGLGTKIVLVEGSDVVGPDLGPGPRPVITSALEELGITVKLGSRVASVDANHVVLASGERIETRTAIWTAGVQASPLTDFIPGAKDDQSRLLVDEFLRVPSQEHVFATGDAARATADDLGHVALMSCQHALVLGRFSGYNAAADLLGKPLMAYSQAAYNCCLDLGASGAVMGAGWDREVSMTGDVAKRVKTYINQKLIYPPLSSEEALEMANPIGPDADELFRHILQAVS